MRYPLVIVRGHFIINDGGRYCMLDTGSLGIVDFNKGQTFGKCTGADMETFLGRRIDCIYGMAFIGRYKTMVISKVTNEVIFDEQKSCVFPHNPANELPISSSMIIPASLNGRAVDTYLDLGAHIPMASARLVGSCPVIGKVNELTAAGFQMLDEVETDIQVGDRHINHSLKMNSTIALNTYGIELFVGADELFDKYFLIDFENKKIIFD